MLVHLTSGQPARGTEIISLRHVNTIHHRNLFVEDGLVAIVTSYHKGYTCTGSTKIIHRYLPKEVGELLVYYLWLILLFAKHVSTVTSVVIHNPATASAIANLRAWKMPFQSYCY